MKSGEGGVVETSWMFQAASPASIHPARSPTRGSGLGTAVEKGRWDGAHAATDNATIANNTSDFIEGSLKGHRACGSCDRSRWSGRRSRRRRTGTPGRPGPRSEEHTSELQSRRDLVCRLLLEKKKKKKKK